MTARYVVQAVPYGNTNDRDTNAPWCVVDMQPELEQYEIRSGTIMTETKVPPWRKVAYCMKRSHADKIATALNVED